MAKNEIEIELTTEEMRALAEAPGPIIETAEEMNETSVSEARETAKAIVEAAKNDIEGKDMDFSTMTDMELQEIMFSILKDISVIHTTLFRKSADLYGIEQQIRQRKFEDGVSNIN
ncbi:MAG: hypothetical protein ACTSW1_08490 [Candidatus Hodarchaeales archaeon]